MNRRLLSIVVDITEKFLHQREDQCMVRRFMVCALKEYLTVTKASSASIDLVNCKFLEF